MSEKPHKRLVAWQKAMEVIEEIYRLTDQFPTDERFGLVAQMRRASISIASNIAEGAARQTSKEQVQFFYVARGSASELDTQVEIAHRLRLLDGQQHALMLANLDQVGRLLNGLIASKR